jgi:hypothetical protein
VHFKQILFSLSIALPLFASQANYAMTQADSNLFVAALSGSESIDPYISNEVSTETLGQALYYAAQGGNLHAVDKLLEDGIIQRIAPTDFARTFNRLVENPNLSEETIINVINRLFACPHARASIVIDDVFQALARAVQARRVQLVIFLSTNAA